MKNSDKMYLKISQITPENPETTLRLWVFD